MDNKAELPALSESHPAKVCRHRSLAHTPDRLAGWLRAIRRFLLPLTAAAIYILTVGCTQSPTGIPWPSMTVNSNGDETDYLPGDGKCQIAANSSVCTLRAAIVESNAYAGEPQTVKFDLPAGDQVIHPQNGAFVITNNIILDGATQPGYDGSTPAVIIDGSGQNSNGFQVQFGNELRIRALEVHNFGGSGIANYGILYLDGVVISAIQHTAIYSVDDSFQTIKNSIIRDSGTQDPIIPTGGLWIQDGTVIINNSTFSGNSGWNSGAIFMEKGELRLNGSTFTGNVGWDAGAVYVAEGADNLLLIQDGTRIGLPGQGNISGVISEGTKLGGGIYSEADVILKDSSIEGNAGAGIQIFHGSGLISLDISGSVIAENSLQGIDAYNTNVSIADSDIRGNQSGGIAMHLGTLNLDQARVTANENGGGILMEGGSLRMTDSTVADNTNFGPGGGVYGHNLNDADINRSTVSGNSSDGDGGGLYLHTFGQAQILNSTISGNRAAGSGGGLLTAGGTFQLTHITVAENESSAAGGILANGSVTLANSILSENVGDNCGASALPSSGEYNLSDDLSCHFGGAGDINDKDARLEHLQDNGGPTQTHALMDDSPAVNAAGDLACPKTDQRGVDRPNGPKCDMGAFESDFLTSKYVPATPTDTPASATATPTAEQKKGVTFDPVEYSANPVFQPSRACSPREVTIRVKVSPAESVKSVGLFYRLESKSGEPLAAWSEGFSMEAQGSGWYALTVYTEDIPGILEIREDSILAVQFVATAPDGSEAGRSAVQRDLVVSPCGR